ncbi:hypothetical protein BC830DRAFT_442820 [Chytriomyces sp. MP71]|nr:hypothetical protein BC830DRAFT_442820 [Chytriomyces sp. MP71]
MEAQLPVSTEASYFQSIRVYVRRNSVPGERDSDVLLAPSLAPNVTVGATHDLPAYRRLGQRNPWTVELFKGSIFTTYGVILVEPLPNAKYENLTIDANIVGTCETSFLGFGWITFGDRVVFYRSAKNIVHQGSGELTRTSGSPFLVIPFAIHVRPGRVLPVSFSSGSVDISYSLNFKLACQMKAIGKCHQDVLFPLRVVHPWSNALPPPLESHQDDDGERIIADVEGNIQGNVNIYHEPELMLLRPRVLSHSPSLDRQRALSPSRITNDDEHDSDSDFTATPSSVASPTSIAVPSIAENRARSQSRSHRPRSMNNVPTTSLSTNDTRRLSLATGGRSFTDLPSLRGRLRRGPLSQESFISSAEDLFGDQDVSASQLAPPYSLEDPMTPQSESPIESPISDIGFRSRRPMSPLASQVPAIYVGDFDVDVEPSREGGSVTSTNRDSQTDSSSASATSTASFFAELDTVQAYQPHQSELPRGNIKGGLVLTSFIPPPRLDSLPVGGFSTPQPHSREPSSPATARRPATTTPFTTNRFSFNLLKPAQQPEFRVIFPSTIAGPEIRIPIDVTIFSIPDNHGLAKCEAVFLARVTAQGGGSTKVENIELARAEVDLTDLEEYNERMWVQVPDAEKMGPHSLAFKLTLVELAHFVDIRLSTRRPAWKLGGKRTWKMETFLLGSVSIEMLR